MDKTFAKSLFANLVIASSVLGLSGCVTQNFENDEPVVENQANRDDMAATRISLGLGYLKMGNMPQAKLNLEKAKRFAPDMVQVYTAFAHYYETVGEFELTEESYKKALSLKSDDGDTLNNYGVFLCRQDKIAEAEKQFLKAIAVPSYLLVAQSYQNLSACFLQEDDFDKAEHYLEKAILHSPNSSAALFQMVRLQYAKANYARAKYFQQKFEKNTRRFSAESLALAYKVHVKLANPRVAKNYGTMLVKMFPQSWEAKQYLLNELEVIDADNLAKRYQLTQHKTKAQSGAKKRVVRLSPNRKAPISSSKKKQTSLAKTNSQATTQATKQISTKAAPAITVADNLAPEAVATPVVVAANSSSAQNTAHVLSSAHDSSNVIASTTDAVVATANDAVASDVEQSSSTASQAAQEDLIASDSNAVTNNPDTKNSVTENTATNNSATDNTPIDNALTDEVVTELAAESAAEKTSAVVDNTSVSDAEPTFTQPVPAKREQPLPEAVIESPTPREQVDSEASIAAAIQEKEQQLSAMLAEQENLAPQAEQNSRSNDVTAVKEPTSEPVTQEVATEDSKQIASANEPVDSTAVVEQANDEIEEKVEQVEQEQLTHKVSAGETLFAISVKYNVKIKALREWNDISANNKLRIGQKLVVADPNQ